MKKLRQIKSSFGRVLLSISAILVYTSLSFAEVSERQLPTSGDPNSQMVKFESELMEIMDTFHIPGGAVAMMKDGKLLYARGFGFADLYTRDVAQPSSLFRIASISKVLTAISIMQLVEQKRLRLDDKAFSLLNNAKPFPGTHLDPRLSDITIRQLLDMSSGMGGSPNWRHGLKRVAKESGQNIPPSKEAFLSFMMGEPLSFDPGTRYKYSNAGYNVLAYIVEEVSNQPFENYVKEHILEPLSIQTTKLGHTLYQERDPQEVYYYMPPGSQKFESIFPEIQRKLACPYGGCFYLESQFGSGAWISSVLDLVKIFDSLQTGGPLSQLLSPESLALMKEKTTHYPNWKSWHGMEWDYKEFPSGLRFSKNRYLPGTSAWVFHNPQGIIIAGLFNSRPHKDDSKRFNRQMSKLLLGACDQVLRKNEEDNAERIMPVKAD